MTEDPILEALLCETHGRIWVRPKYSFSMMQPLIWIGTTGFCLRCVEDLLNSKIHPLKRVRYSQEDEDGTREGVPRDDA